MESGLFFTAAVIGVGVLHLAWQAATFLRKKTAPLSASRPAKSPEGKRADWYVFFFRSDVTGKEVRKKVPTTPRTGQTNNKQVNTQRRRSSQRMHLS